MKRNTFRAIALAVTMSPLVWWSANAAAGVALTHVHGLTYAADRATLLVPSHHGLAVYSSGQWSKAPGPEHDYMGFTGTRNALYSSGHPAPGSGLKNPFGLIKSTDGGKSWKQLVLQGESDFHTLAASYGTNAVYVVNSQTNSQMETQGVYFTTNDGEKWQRVEAAGLAGRVHGLAVHPSDSATVAAAADQGLFLSKDAGASFKPVASGKRVLAATFTFNGNDLWWSGYDGGPTLSVLDLRSGEKLRTVNLPNLGEDAVSFIAQNPVRTSEMAIATFKKSIFISKNAGKSWVRIADQGKTVADPAIAGMKGRP